MGFNSGFKGLSIWSSWWWTDWSETRRDK